jgi:hypothetical protein
MTKCLLGSEIVPNSEKPLVFNVILHTMIRKLKQTVWCVVCGVRCAVWCGVVWCRVVWSVVWCGVKWCVMWCGVRSEKRDAVARKGENVRGY